MTRETVYLVQAFTAGKGTRLAADTPIRCKSPDGARRTAERLAPTKAGVVAFATSGEAESGDYDEEPTIIFKAGHLLAPFEEA
jgi:hypothetical protein